MAVHTEERMAEIRTEIEASMDFAIDIVRELRKASAEAQAEGKLLEFSDGRRMTGPEAEAALGAALAPLNAGIEAMRAPARQAKSTGKATGSGNVVQVDGNRQAPAKAPLIMSSKAFVSGFTPPDYLVDGLLLHSYIYALTAPTGWAKTAIALLFAAHIGLRLPIGEHKVEGGRVVYFAGENAVDVRMRWMAMAHVMGFDPDAIDVHFVPEDDVSRSERLSIPKVVERLRAEIGALGGASFIVVDTSAVYYEGNDENDNVQMHAHAKMLRDLLTTLPGAPCVLILCHPTKNAQRDNLLPRGGGAFLAAIDGNLVCLKKDAVIDFHWQGKLRGVDFAPISFELVTVTAPTLIDRKGRLIPTVMAKPLTEKDCEALQAAARRHEDLVLVLLHDSPGASIKGMAEALDWWMGKGDSRKPAKSRVQRALSKLKRDGFARTERDGWELTEKGQKEAKRIKSATPVPDAVRPHAD